MQATTPSLTLPEHERRGDRGTRSWSRRASSPGPTMTRPIPQILCYLASRRHGPTSTHQRVLDRTTKCLFFFPPSILYSRAKSCRSPVAAAVALYQKSKGTGPKRRPYKESQTATSATSRPYRLNYYKKTFFWNKTQRERTGQRRSLAGELLFASLRRQQSRRPKATTTIKKI